MKKFIIIVLILFGLVGCSDNEENTKKNESLESKLADANEQIEKREAQIAKLTEELTEEKKKLQELQKTFEDYKYPYYVSAEPEVRSEDGVRLNSYAFIIKGIANRILHIDGLIEDGKYNDEQIRILKKEREYVWQL